MPQQPASRSITSAPGMTSQQLEHRSGADQRTLVTVCLHEDLPRAGLPVERAPRLRHQDRGQELLERPARCRDRLRLGPQLALQQRGIIIPDRQDAARLAGDDRSALARPIVETLDIVPGIRHGLIE